MVDSWKTTRSRIVHSNKFWKIKRDSFLTGSGSKGDYEYVETPGGVIVIPFLDDEKVLVIKQYRFPNKKEVYEFPGGGIIPSMSVDDCAKKELEQETGYSCKKLRKIGSFYPYTGLSSEICHVLVAKELAKCNQKPESTEDIELMAVDLDDVDELLQKTFDGKAITAWYMFKNKK